MNPISRKPRLAVAALAVTGMTVGGFFAGNAIAADHIAAPEQVSGLATSPDGSPPAVKMPTFPVNAQGLTFGSSEGVDLENLPDLLLVTATNGLTGYVYSDVLNEITGANVASPEEAVAYQQRMDAETWETKQIPVFLFDGLIQIGSFEISRSQGTSTTD